MVPPVGKNIAVLKVFVPEIISYMSLFKSNVLGKDITLSTY